MTDILNYAGGILLVGFIFYDVIYSFRNYKSNGPLLSAKYQMTKIIIFVIMTALFQSIILCTLTALCAIVNTLTLYNIAQKE